MTNTQMYLAIGIPTLVGIFNMGVIVTLILHFSNKLDARIDKLDTKMDKRFDGIDQRLDLIQRDQREFYATQRVHDEAIETLKKGIK